MSAPTTAASRGEARSLATRALLVAGVVVACGCGSRQDRDGHQFDESAPPARSSDGRLSTGLLSPPDPAVVDGRTVPASISPAERRIPDGTLVTAWLETTLDSGSARVGDAVRATIISDVFAQDGGLALPAGGVITGTVTEVASADRARESAFLEFRFDHAELADGGSASIRAHEGVNTDGWTGRGAALAPSSGPDADLIGQLIGPATDDPARGDEGSGLLMARRGDDVVLEAGSVLNLILDGDVILPEPTASRASYP